MLHRDEFIPTRQWNPFSPPKLLTCFLALGDSYTIGESVPESDRWPVQLANQLREQDLADFAEPIIIAKTGWTAGELAEAIGTTNPKGPFDLVTLLIGVNNQYRGLPLDEYQHEFRDLLSTATRLAGGNADHVIVLSIPDWSATSFAEGRDRIRIASEIDAFNAVNLAEAMKAGARYVDITPISRRAATDGGLIAGDGLHPSGKMYREWAELVLPEALAALGD